MYFITNKATRCNVNSQGSIKRSRLKEVELEYIDFSSSYGARVYFATKTKTEYTSVYLPLNEDIKLQTELTRAIEESKNMATEFAIKNNP